MSARGCARPSNNEFVLGNNLSSKHAPATPLSSNFRTKRLALLKFPQPVSASRRIGRLDASLIYSSTSNTWVHEASLLSRTPKDAEMDSPLPQIPLNPIKRSVEHREQMQRYVLLVKTLQIIVVSKQFNCRFRLCSNTMIY